jgi:hypothetical protein
MKQILIACLLGMGTLLPTSEAKSNAIINFIRTVNIHISGWVLIADSGTEDGTISKIEIYKLSTGQKVLTQACSNGYSCEVNIVNLEPGNYSAKIICQYTTQTRQFVR